MSREELIQQLAGRVDGWNIGTLISYACQHRSTETVWAWTVPEMIGFIKKEYIKDLGKVGDNVLAMLVKEGQRSGPSDS